MKASGWKYVRNNPVLYLLMLPGLLYFAVFKYAPMGGVVIAFKQFQIADGLWRSPWVGFDNFQRFFSGVYFGQIMLNTLLISFYKLVIGFPAPILLALMLNEIGRKWYKRVMQTLSYLPHFLSWVIIYGLMIAFLAPNEGLVNQLLHNAGWDKISFLTEPEWIRTLLVASDVWQGIGWGAIIYLAAITAVDPSLYEAAIVDGASKWRQIWHITLPGIRTVILLMLILRLSHILDAGFDQVFVMANALNQEKADIIDTWVYRVGFQQMQYGIATAVGLFKAAIGFVLVLGSNRIAKKFDGQIW